jgi:hypothetical protein
MVARYARALSLGLLLTGCGYAWVTAGEGVQIGAIIDLSAEGDLGLTARTHLRRLAGKPARNAAQVDGRIRVLPERPGGFDAGGATLYHAPVELILTVEHATGRPWQHKVTVDATFVRGPTTTETWASRRIALKQAVEQGVERWWARWTSRGRR